MEVGPEEGQIVVALIPEDDVAPALGLLEDLGVCDSCIDDLPLLDVRLVLLPLLDRTRAKVEVLEPLEALAA